MIYYLGLGSNLGRRPANLARARRLLERGGVEVLAASSVYETEPVDYADQPWFLNQVLKVRSQLDPPELLRLAKAVEAEMKRAPTVAKGPRTIDIDILFAGDLVLETPGLVIPHPRLQLRNFVLVPLKEIAPRLRHPVFGKTVAELALSAGDPGRVKKRIGPRSLRSGP
ncbi:MAG: 2-amino-4-hydroxy-6-hydroxymethyldihydropteridine diphosphokinase [Candidatus Aminicenantales bacterium]